MTPFKKFVLFFIMFSLMFAIFANYISRKRILYPEIDQQITWYYKIPSFYDEAASISTNVLSNKGNEYAFSLICDESGYYGDLVSFNRHFKTMNVENEDNVFVIVEFPDGKEDIFLPFSSFRTIEAKDALNKHRRMWTKVEDVPRARPDMKFPYPHNTVITKDRAYVQDLFFSKDDVKLFLRYNQVIFKLDKDERVIIKCDDRLNRMIENRFYKLSNSCRIPIFPKDK